MVKCNFISLKVECKHSPASMLNFDPKMRNMSQLTNHTLILPRKEFQEAVMIIIGITIEALNNFHILSVRYILLKSKMI